MSDPGTAADRELAYYEQAYTSYVPELFAQPAVVEFRRYLVNRILKATGAGRQSRILSIGCGIGDTELLLAQRVAHVTGVDFSPSAIAHAQSIAAQRSVDNVRFICGKWPLEHCSAYPFDVVVAIFFLHHLTEADLAVFPGQVAALLRDQGSVYTLDPSARRLSGFLGQCLTPKLMKKYQTEDEGPLAAQSTCSLFSRSGFHAQMRWFDFVSTPLAGLFPSWTAGYAMGRVLDDALTRIPLLRSLSSNFEIIARLPNR